MHPDKCLISDERGSIMPIIAAAMMLVLGFSALAVDVGMLYVERARLQIAADAAALAATPELPDQQNARAKALSFARRNWHNEGAEMLQDDDIEIGTWDPETKTIDTSGAPTAIKVDVKRLAARGNAVTTSVAGILGVTSMDLTASSVAAKPAATACVMIMEPTENSALNVGNGLLSAPNCRIYVNSSSPYALDGNSAGRVVAKEICVVGPSAGTSTASFSPDPEVNCEPMEDPLAGFVPPPYGTCDHTNLSVRTGGTLSPGVYCGWTSLRASNIDLEPGTYVFKDGGVTVANGVNVTANGVTFHLVEAGLNFSSADSIHIKAPSSGPFAGFAVYAEPEMVGGDRTSTLHGGANAHFEGTFYLPTQQLVLGGNNTGSSSSPFSTFVVWRLSYSGQSELTINSDYGLSDVPMMMSTSQRSVVLMQ